MRKACLALTSIEFSLKGVARQARRAKDRKCALRAPNRLLSVGGAWSIGNCCGAPAKLIGHRRVAWHWRSRTIGQAGKDRHNAIGLGIATADKAGRHVAHHVARFVTPIVGCLPRQAAATCLWPQSVAVFVLVALGLQHFDRSKVARCTTASRCSHNAVAAKWLRAAAAIDCVSRTATHAL